MDRTAADLWLSPVSVWELGLLAERGRTATSQRSDGLLDLDGVADRWSVEELRAIVVNSKAALSEDTIMPGFYTLDVGIDVRKDLVGSR